MADSKSIKVNIDVIVNQAKQAMTEMAKTTADATKSLNTLNATGASAKKSTDDLSASLNKSSTSWREVAKGVLGGEAAYGLASKAINGMIGFLKSSLQEAAEAEKAHAQLNAVLKSTGGVAGMTAKSVTDLANALAESTVYQDDAIVSAQNMLLTFTNIGKNVFPDTTKAVLDMATAMGTDLQSTAIQVGKALQDPINGVTSLQRVGVRLTESQKDLVQSLVETGKTAEAQRVILKELATEFGGSSSAAAETYAGKLQQMNNKVKELKQALGIELQKALVTVFTFLQNNIKVIEMVAAAIGAMYATKVITGFASLATGIGGITMSMNALKLALLANPFTVIAAVAAAAAVAIGSAIGKLQEAKAALYQSQVAADNLYQSMADAYNKTHEGAKLTLADFQYLRDGTSATADQMRILKESTTALSAEQKKASDALEAQQNAKAKAEQDAIKAEDAKKAAIDAHKKAMDELKQAYVDVTQKQSEFTFKGVEDFARFGKTLADTKSSQDVWLNSAKQGFSAFKSAIENVNSTIDNLKGKMDDAKKSYQDFLNSTKKEAGGTFASIVNDAEQSLPDLQKQLQKAQSGNSGGNNDEQIADLQKQIADKQSIISTSQKTEFQSNQEFMDQLKFLREQNSKDELQQAYDVMQQKIDAKKKETDENLAQLEKQIAAATDERDKFVAAQAVMTQAFAENLKLRQKTAQGEIASLSALKASVDSVTAAYNAMAAAANSAKSGGGASSGSAIKGKASGGPVAGGTTYLVGENGPELFTPNVSGGITPNDKISSGMGGTVININYPTVRSDSDLREIVAAVEQALGRREELAGMGAYK